MLLNTFILNTLIIFFIFLIGYQIILANSRVREGVENQCDTAGDAYRLSQKNSSEITLLKDSMTKSEEKIYKRMDTLDEQMKEVMQSIKEMGNEISKPTTPTGEVVE
jgi:peptidoglycan hydrolase CwlO-like protein